MRSDCPHCGASLTPDRKFCEECGAPVLENTPLESPPTVPQKDTQNPPGSTITPASSPVRSIRPLYIIAALVVLVVLGGVILLYSGILEPDPVVGTWSYSKEPLTVWIRFSNDKSCEVVITDSSDGLYLDDDYRWENTGANEYGLCLEGMNRGQLSACLMTLNLSDTHDQLRPAYSLSDAVLTRTTESKPSPSALTRNRTSPRFTPGDIVDLNPFRYKLVSVILAYYPESDEYAKDMIWYDGQGYHSLGELNYTERYRRGFIDPQYVKLDHVNINAIEIRKSL